MGAFIMKLIEPQNETEIKVCCSAFHSGSSSGSASKNRSLDPAPQAKPKVVILQSGEIYGSQHRYRKPSLESDQTGTYAKG